MNPNFTAEAAAQLREGINLVLERWWALRMAVVNEAGGPKSHEKAEELANDLFETLTQSKVQVYWDSLVDMLYDFMDVSFTTDVGDGSIEEIAEKLMFMREECLVGNFASIKRLKETNAPSVSYVKQPAGDEEEESDDDDGDDDRLEEDKSSEMEVDTSEFQLNLNQKNATDEPSIKEVPEVVDGWTVVSSRRSKGRKT